MSEIVIEVIILIFYFFLRYQLPGLFFDSRKKILMPVFQVSSKNMLVSMKLVWVCVLSKAPAFSKDHRMCRYLSSRENHIKNGFCSIFQLFPNPRLTGYCTYWQTLWEITTGKKFLFGSSNLILSQKWDCIRLDILNSLFCFL